MTTIVLSIVCGLLLVLSFLLYYLAATINYQSNEDFNQLLLDTCELSNETNELINDLIVELRQYNPAYSDINFLNIIDCEDIIYG